MKLDPSFRAATIADCPKIAELFSMASDGVSDYIWSTLTDEYPGLTLLEIGAKRYANEQRLFSYKNCIVAEQAGEVIGMMLTFPIEESTDAPEPPADEALPSPSPTSEPDVLAPYNLEAPGTWYICGLAVFPEFRGQGLGTQFLSIARQQAQSQGFKELSLLCFAQNTGAFRLYQRHGFKEIDRTPVVPHPLIHHTGDLLLMTVAV
jgi:ribosomal protein S18 acetylase RimI-like enzyme